MDRTSAAGYTDIGGGKRGYRDRNLGSGIPGTSIVAADKNAVQEEILAVIEAAGLTPASGDWDQLWEALNIHFRPRRQVFASSGTFTVPAGITRVFVQVWGAGGGGGGASTNGAGTGGAAGGYTEEVVTVTPAAAITVTVGAGGAAGPAGGASNGGPGGTSSFGGFCSATGGGGGYGGNGSVPTTSPTVGAGSGGDLNLSGQTASFGTAIGSQYFGGQGGGAPFGGGPGHAMGSGADAAPGRFPGGGGNGSGSPGGSFAGGAGAAGLVIVEW